MSNKIKCNSNLEIALKNKAISYNRQDHYASLEGFSSHVSTAQDSLRETGHSWDSVVGKARYNTVLDWKHFIFCMDNV